MLDPCEDVVFSPDWAESLALLMERDDATGGWVPVSEGGPCKVSVRTGVIPDGSDEMYFIFVQKVSDDSVALCCFISEDFEYNRAMPTFHHWKVRDNKYGLAFETLAGAKVFERGIRAAIGDTGEESPPPLTASGSEHGDDHETLELPDLGVDSESDVSVRDNSQTTPQEQAAQMSHSFKVGPEAYSPTLSQDSDNLELSIDQEYMHPDAEGPELVQHGSNGSPKKNVTEETPQKETESSNKDKKKSGRHRCRYCHEIYVEEQNKRGACEYAPDCVRTTIDEVSCVRAARCMMYHCMSDEEGEFAQHPCECTCGGDNNSRWMALAFLSIFVPCLCLYPPLRSCQWCCSRVGLCGGRHRSAS